MTSLPSRQVLKAHSSLCMVNESEQLINESGLNVLVESCFTKTVESHEF